ncbi:hypothetical protein GCM10023191_042350 [Actinoallomurus oryzae]|uniref:MmyB-like transcription regulator ligand binding domain-containing protein n=1 Tax=Actinoallomurus oryzae TaxID=502180 RepID=A0ABP8Q8Q4_9ACTN
MVAALARALRLGRAEYERLCALSGHAAADGQVPREVGAGAIRLLERLDGTPVCLCDAAWNVVAWNGAWAALRCGEPTAHRWDGNIAWRTFGGAPSRVRRTAERVAGFETMLAARLRTASLRYPADTSLAALVDELRSESGMFDGLAAGRQDGLFPGGEGHGPLTVLAPAETLLLGRRDDGSPQTTIAPPRPSHTSRRTGFSTARPQATDHQAERLRSRRRRSTCSPALERPVVPM